MISMMSATAARGNKCAAPLCSKVLDFDVDDVDSEFTHNMLAFFCAHVSVNSLYVSFHLLADVPNLSSSLAHAHVNETDVQLGDLNKNNLNLI
jgi:hypothetical protein